MKGLETRVQINNNKMMAYRIHDGLGHAWLAMGKMGGLAGQDLLFGQIPSKKRLGPCGYHINAARHRC